MQEHYRSYKESAESDFPVGFIQYANRNPDTYKYFVSISHKITDSILQDNRDMYRHYLGLHQKALLKEITEFCKDVSYKNMPLKIWKFTTVVIKYTNFTWIPRYEEQFTRYSGPLFSCWEMETALKMGQKVQLLLDKKGDKILTPQQQLINKEDVNWPLVQDWTLPV